MFVYRRIFKSPLFVWLAALIARAIGTVAVVYSCGVFLERHMSASNGEWMFPLVCAIAAVVLSAMVTLTAVFKFRGYRFHGWDYTSDLSDIPPLWKPLVWAAINL